MTSSPQSSSVGREKLRGGERYGVPLMASLEDAIAHYDPEVVIDLSDEPILGPVERFALASRALALGVVVRGGRLPFRAARARGGRAGDPRRDRDREAGGQDRGHRSSCPSALAEPKAGRRRDGAGWPGRARARTRRADHRGSARTLACGSSRVLGSSRDGPCRRCRDDRLPALRRWPGGRCDDVECARGCGARRDAGPRSDRSRRQWCGNAPRGTPERRSSSSVGISGPSSSPDI